MENSAEQSWELRECLFSNALKCKLAADGDVLVTRKKWSVRSVRDKHAEDIWILVGAIQRCVRSCPLCPPGTLKQKVSPKQSLSNFKMTCWNCRGLPTSLPYLDNLIHEGSKILVLSEHWLCPYNPHRLNDINQEFNAIGKADSRRTEEKGMVAGDVVG